MKCANCQFENPFGFTYCGNCGQSLSYQTCPHCQSQLPPDFVFCGQCGQALSKTINKLSTADLDHLRVYLPTNLIEALQFELSAPTHSLLQQCNTHLAYLLATMASHLPFYVVEQVAENPKIGEASGRFMTGTLLFADISGFTAMSEKLSRIGREGAEEVTAIVNRYFDEMLTILSQHDGQLIKFGGDALLGLFAEPPAASATRAVRAALQMQAAMAEFSQTKTSQGTFPLQMKVAVHYGRFFAAQLGTAHSMEYALFGSDVNQTAALESAAVAGQIVLDEATLKQVEGEVTAVPLHDNIYILQSLSTPNTPQHPKSSNAPLLIPDDTLSTLRRAVELLDALAPYLPAGLLNRIALNPAATDLTGEHRLVSILFTNIHGLGDIVDQLGEGQENAIVAALNQIFIALAAPLEQYGGVVNKIDLYDHGDKLLAFFGAPIAHEDDAERAVRAALQIQATMAELAQTLPQRLGLPDLNINQHIGISYGYVFAGYVGADWRHEYTVMGDEVNLGARLMSVATANAIIVSRAVQRKVQALFDLPPRGDVQLKGKQNPTPIYEVTGIRAVPEPLRGLKGMHSPLVGRDAEWARLQAALEQLPQNRGQIVAVMGEAGLGKSRLVAEMQRFTAENAEFVGTHWFEGRCLSYTESVSYWPFQDMLRSALGLSADEDSTVALTKLREALIYFMSADEAWDSLPFIANFLNLDLGEELQEKIRYLDAEGLQRRTYLALRSLMSAQSHRAPTIMVLDDLHWLDNASFRLLEYLLPQVNQLPIMFVLIFRPERTKICWQIHEHASRDFDYCYTPITLTHLPTEATDRLLANLVGISHWPEGVRQLIFNRTEGNPLYLEEVLRSLINDEILVRDNGGWQLMGDVTAVRVPDTLQGVMMARLDRLQEPSRLTAQVASVIGRSFPYDIISHVATDTLNQSPTPHLVQLQQYEIVEEAQRSPELVYSFQHTMMQEVCYRSLATRARRRFHQQIAHYLEMNQLHNMSEARGLLPLIAHHAFEGQDWGTALRYEILSGQQAQKLFANDEALDHFRKALRCTTQVTTITMRESLQTIHTSMGELLVVMSQYEEAQSHLEQAFALAQKREDTEGQAYACRWLARSFELRGDYAAAFEWIDKGLVALNGQQTAESAQLLLIAGLIHTRQGDSEKGLSFALNASQIAQQVQELAALARANNLMGHILRARGERATAVSHFQEALALYQQVGDINGQATALNQIATVYILSDWPQAEQYFREARAMYDQMGDIYHRVFAENNLAEVLLKRGTVAEAIQTYEEALTAMEQIGGSAYVLGALHNNLGSAYVRQGDAALARQHLRESHDLFEKAQARDFLPELHRHLAEAALLTADLTEAVSQAETALALARELEMPTEEACSLRVLGEALGLQGETAVAQQHLQTSINILAEMAEEEYELARCRLVLAQLYAEMGQIVEAQSIAEACLAVFSRLAAMGDVTAVKNLQQKIESTKET